MKFNKKVIALLLALSIVLSVVIPVWLTNGAVASTGINVSYYRAESYIGGRNLYEDANNARVGYENNKQFDKTIDGLIESSFLASTETGVTGTRTKGGDYNIVKWTGTMTAKTSGAYTIIGRKIDNGFVMFVDGQKVYEYWGASHWFDGASDRLLSDLGSFTVTAGQTYEVEMYYLELGGGEALDIYATTTPDDLESGAHINDTFTFNLTEEWYKNLDVNSHVNEYIGTGNDGAGGNGGQCIESNFKFDESIDGLLEGFDFRGSYVVNSFSDIRGDDRYILVYEGVMVPKTTGAYTFGASAVDNGFALDIDGVRAYEFWAGGTWNDNGGNTYTSSINLTAGTAYPFKAYFLEIDGGEVLTMNASINGGTASNVADLFSFYPVSSTLNLTLGSVNLLSGATTVNSSSVLTVQYTDATLGDNVEMYAKITKTDGTVLVEKQKVGSAFLRPTTATIVGATEEIGVSSEGDTASKTVYANTAGNVTFSPSISGTHNVSDLKVTIWTENSAMTNISSPKATTTITNGFTSSTPSGLTGSNWMNYIDGSTLLSQINMPGSHDAGSVYFASMSGYNKCQSVHVNTQLTYGARLFDIRPSVVSGNADGNATTTTTLSNGATVTDFGISHSTYLAYTDSNTSTVLKFSNIYEWCKAFLEANPSETIVFTFNNENINDRGILTNAIHSFVAADPELFYTKGNEIPTLDDVRGKIVLFRRFPGVWAAGDNSFFDFYWIDQAEGATPHAMVPVSNSNGVALYYIQDEYGTPSSTSCGSSKFSKASAMVDQAASSKKANEFYLNYFSTANAEQPETSSGNTNPKFISDITLTKGTQYGYLLFDFITAEIAAKVYNSNTFTTTAQISGANGDHVNEKVVHYDFADVENGIVDDTEDNGFDGLMSNADVLDYNTIYNTMTFNNQNKTGNSGAGYVAIPQSVFSGTGDTVTLQVWIKETGTQARDTWFSIGKDANGVSGNYFVANTKWDGGGLRYALSPKKTNAAGDSPQGSAISQNTWHLLTYVINGTSMNVYVDGNSTPVLTGGAKANFQELDPGIFVDSPVTLGGPSHWMADDGFVGSMGDFTIYNYAVGTSEIASTYTALAEEYTYILKASLGDGMTAIASETASDNYISEKYTDTGSTILLTAPEDFDTTSAKLALEYDGSKVEISTNGGSTYTTFNADTAYDFSKNVKLRVTSLNGTRTKVYDVQVEGGIPVASGVVVYDYDTGAELATYETTNGTVSLADKVKDENYLFTQWYAADKTTTITSAADGDVVYLKRVAITDPESSGKSIRVQHPYGVRFLASISRDAFYEYFNGTGDYTYSAAKDFKFGMVIIPTDLLGGNELTLDTPKVKDIVAEKIYNQNNNGELQFTGVIAWIPEAQYEREFSARAYIQFTYEGTTYTIYSDVTNTGSYKSVATSVYNDSAIDQSIKDTLEEIFGGPLN